MKLPTPLKNPLGEISPFPAISDIKLVWVCRYKANDDSPSSKCFSASKRDMNNSKP